MAFCRPTHVTLPLTCSPTSCAQLALQTVLRTLLDSPDAFALWLDTTSTFSAERAQRMLSALANERRDSISVDMADSRPPLDRLIVARSFELGSITRLVQKVAKEGFPGDEAVDEKADEEKEEMRIDVVPETAGAAEDAAPSLTGGFARLQESSDAHAQPAQRRPMQLRFIIINSVTPVFRTLLSAVSAEGHAKMVSFMRLLRSLPCVTLLTNSTTTSAPSGPGLSVFPSLRGTKPALGPTFTYLCDWTIWIGRTGEAFPASTDERGRIVEVWRSRRAVSELVIFGRTQADMAVHSLPTGGQHSRWMASTTCSIDGSNYRSLLRWSAVLAVISFLSQQAAKMKRHLTSVILLTQQAATPFLLHQSVCLQSKAACWRALARTFSVAASCEVHHPVEASFS